MVGRKHEDSISSCHPPIGTCLASFSATRVYLGLVRVSGRPQARSLQLTIIVLGVHHVLDRDILNRSIRKSKHTLTFIKQKCKVDVAGDFLKSFGRKACSISIPEVEVITDGGRPVVESSMPIESSSSQLVESFTDMEDGQARMWFCTFTTFLGLVVGECWVYGDHNVPEVLVQDHVLKLSWSVHEGSGALHCEIELLQIRLEQDEGKIGI